MLVRQRQVSREHSRMRQYDRPRLLSRNSSFCRVLSLTHRILQHVGAVLTVEEKDSDLSLRGTCRLPSPTNNGTGGCKRHWRVAQDPEVDPTPLK